MSPLDVFETRSAISWILAWMAVIAKFDAANFRIEMMPFVAGELSEVI